jgi:hypothetical protein
MHHVEALEPTGIQPNDFIASQADEASVPHIWDEVQAADRTTLEQSAALRWEWLGGLGSCTQNSSRESSACLQRRTKLVA